MSNYNEKSDIYGTNVKFPVSFTDESMSELSQDLEKTYIVAEEREDGEQRGDGVEQPVVRDQRAPASAAPLGWRGPRAGRSVHGFAGWPVSGGDAPVSLRPCGNQRCGPQELCGSPHACVYCRKDFSG